MTVADVLRGSPAAVRVCVERHMNCPGCPFAPFETVAEVALAYGQDPNDLAAALAQARLADEAAQLDDRPT
jgi:hybrid cluster-associated redox disulfide protein